MRVTKLVREYIEESVGKALNTPTTAENEYKAFTEELYAFIHSVEEEVKQSIKEAIENYRIAHNIPDDIKISQTDYSLIRYDTWGSAIRNEAEIQAKKRREAKERAIKDIMLTLELGGTKADLDAMLSKVATEYNI